MATTTERPALDPLDYLAIDALLDDEERAIRDTVRAVRPRQRPRRRRRLVREGHLPARALPGARASSASSGCTSRDTASRERAPSPTGSPAWSSRPATPGCAAPSRYRARSRCSRSGSWGSEEQKERWLPPMHTGEVIGCFGLTEPDAGSDPGSMRTHARRDGSDWILNGAKMWITNGTIADIAIVWARTDDGRDPRLHRREGHARLLGARDPQEALAARVGHLRARAAGRPRARREPSCPGATTLRGPLSCLNEARFGIVFGAVGSGRACFEARSSTRRSGSCSASRSPATS